jgi:lysozyme family protein
MAEFKHAFDKTIKHEGGYAKVSGDAGGETYMGIARKFHPNWAGWEIVDSYTLRHNQKINSTELNSHVKLFYYHEFWQPMAGDFLENQHIADFVFDWHVNSGKSGLKAIQRALGLKDDGFIGEKSIAALNKAKIEDLKAARVQFFKNIVKAKPSQKKFLAGWLNRVNSY